MKAIKRTIAIVISLCLMVSSFAMSAIAEAPTGTITIKDPASSEATVAGKTFELYRIFYATTDGENTSYSWYADKDNPEVNHYYEFFATLTDNNGSPLVTSGKTPEEYDSIQAVVNHISTNYATNFELATLAEQIHDYIEANNIDDTDTIIAGTNDDEVVFTDLPYGYYLVYDATTLQGSAVRSAVMVDTVNSDIDIELKANRPELQKQVLENDETTYGEATSAEIGDVVQFKITTYIPSHMYYNNYEYYIEDVMPDGLALNPGSVSVNIDNAAVTEDNLSDYCTITEDTTANSFKVELTDAALNAEATKLPTNTKIEVIYEATINSEIELGRTTNTATLYYSNDPKKNDPTDPNNNSKGSVQDNAYVYTYMFVLTKYLIDDTGNVSATARLSGAQFKIYSVDENGDKTLLTFSEAQNEKADNKLMYVVGGTAEELTVLDGDLPGQVRNATYYGGNRGDITIFGLKEGTYYIEETKAPDGYVTPADGFTITISDTIDANGDISTLTATVGAHSSSGAIGNYGGEATTYLTWMDIGNTAGDMLPNTGGMGTTIFTLLGVVLMAGAVAFFTSRKRSSVA